jgi:hypothetical protein
MVLRFFLEVRNVERQNVETQSVDFHRMKNHSLTLAYVLGYHLTPTMGT